jgi:hypothetical protein
LVTFSTAIFINKLEPAPFAQVAIIVAMLLFLHRIDLYSFKYFAGVNHLNFTPAFGVFTDMVSMIEQKG